MNEIQLRNTENIHSRITIDEVALAATNPDWLGCHQE